MLSGAAEARKAGGVPAGFLIAALVWSSPAAGSSRFWLVVFLSYMISVGDLTHIIAGAVELFVLLFAGEASLYQVVVQGILPTGIGNILGGTVFFALLAYAQAREELDAATRREPYRCPIPQTTPNCQRQLNEVRLTSSYLMKLELQMMGNKQSIPVLYAHQ